MHNLHTQRLHSCKKKGCKHFGICVFEECCSLVQIGAQGDAANQLAPQAQVRPRAFEKMQCIADRLASFFCTGMGAVCAERHKSPEMNSKRGERGQEPDQRATTAQPPPKQQTPKTPSKTQPKRPTNNQHQIRLMSAQCELQKVKMRGSNTGVKRGNELSSGCTQYRLSTIQ